MGWDTAVGVVAATQGEQQTPNANGPHEVRWTRGRTPPEGALLLLLQTCSGPASGRGPGRGAGPPADEIFACARVCSQRTSSHCCSRRLSLPYSWFQALRCSTAARCKSFRCRSAGLITRKGAPSLLFCRPLRRSRPRKRWPSSPCARTRWRPRSATTARCTCAACLCVRATAWASPASCRRSRPPIQSRRLRQLAGAAEFDAFMEALGVPPKPYVGGAAVRHVVHGNVFTSNESPPSETIPFHHEMALVASPPSRIAFFCQLPAASGGETSLLHSQELYRRALLVSPQFMARLAAEGLLYKRTLSREDDPSSAQGRGWLSTYAADGHERASVEAAMRASGVSGWEWLADGGLRTTTGPLPAFRTDARTGQPAFFNALLAVFTGWTDKRNMGPECVRFGGGGALPAEGVAAVAELAAALAVDIAWEKGDVMLVDNMLAQHSRRPFQGPRRTLAYITE